MATGSHAAQLHADGLSVERDGRSVLHEVSLTVAAGDRIGLVGSNGVGKSTLLQALAGMIPLEGGRVAVVPTDATVGLLGQELAVVPGETVAELVARRTGVAAASDELDRASAALAAGSTSDESSVAESSLDELLGRHAAALDRWLALGGADLEARLDQTLDAVGFDPAGGRGATIEAAVLSGGEQARVGLAALLLARYDVLLLDEPTNNLDRAGLDLLESFVSSAGLPLIVVSHDRRFLDAIVTSVVELDGHTRSATIYNETWLGYLRAREVAGRHAAERYAGYESERARLAERARTQRRWSEQGVGAERRPTDNDRAARGFRLDRTEKQASKARQTERAIERLEEVEKPWQPWELQFSIGETARSGDLVAELVEAEVALGTFRMEPVSLTISAGDRLVVLGENGAGKTTLIRALLGEIELTGGTQRLGRSVVVGRLDQGRERLTTSGDVLDAFTVETGLVPEEARSLLAKFGLGATHLSRPSTAWSPGERTRVVLAAFQATGVNTLVLDEPTNHLDLPAIEQLEQALGRYRGTLIVVSHDRAFLDAVDLTRAVTVDDGRLVVDNAT